MATVTIKNVARLAGVSTATVSRVLNRSGYVEPETAQLVTKAVEKLGFRRDLNWRRLVRGTSETVCFLSGVRDAVNSSLTRTLVACERVFNSAGYDLVFQTFDYNPDQPASELRLPHLIGHKGGVNGVILVDVHYENLLDAMTRFNVPFVGLGNNILGSDEQLVTNFIFYDDDAAFRGAVKYLYELGHRRIAFVGKPAPWFRRRYEGYLRGLQDFGLEEISIRDAWQIGNIEYGRRAAARLLHLQEPPTAILGGNDEIAAGVWNELINRGSRIPQDMSLIGFGDREEFSVLEPPLTTIALSPGYIGEELARMLLQKLDRPELQIPSRNLNCELMVRGSCAPPAGHTVKAAP